MAENRVLYWGSGSGPCWRVLLCLEEKGLAFESKLLQFSKQEHKSAEVLALNPRGELPTFKDGDAVVNESGAILLYLESQYPDNPLIPSDASTKARVYQRFFETITLGNKMFLFALPKMRGLENPQEEQHITDFKAELTLWEGYTAKYKYLAADTLTLADLMFAPVVMTANRFGMTFDNHPNLKKYYELMKDHPTVVKTWPPNWKESPSKLDFMKIF